MASTLTEYKYLGNDAEIRMGIAQTIVKEYPWLSMLPFVEINNNATRYKMELSEARADVYEVGETWIEGTPEWEYRESPLCILGGDADDDNFGRLASGEDTMAAIVELKSKAIANMFAQKCILGQTTSNAIHSASKNMKGLIRLNCECETASANTGATDLDGVIFSSYGSGAGNNTQVIVAAASASATLTLDMLDVLVRIPRPKPTHIITHWIMLNKIASLARAAGNNLQHDMDQLGMPVTRYGEQILVNDDYCPTNFNDPSSSVCSPASWDNTQASAGAKDTTPIWAVRFGEDGLCGINGEGMINVEKFDKLETKDAKRVRIKFYCGMRLTNKLALAGLYGATNT